MDGGDLPCEVRPRPPSWCGLEVTPGALTATSPARCGGDARTAASSDDDGAPPPDLDNSHLPSSISNPMGYEESKNHLSSLSYQELQCLCKRYNLPAKKTHTQLASLLASLLVASHPAGLTTPLSTVKETATCGHVSNKRGPYNGRDDGRPPAHVKHQKGSQTLLAPPPPPPHRRESTPHQSGASSNNVGGSPGSHVGPSPPRPSSGSHGGTSQPSRLP